MHFIITATSGVISTHRIVTNLRAGLAFVLTMMSVFGIRPATVSAARLRSSTPATPLVLAPASVSVRAPSIAPAFTGSGPCFATLDGVTVYESPNADAVQQAVDAAAVNDTVKVAGICAGVQSRAGSIQSVYISKTLTLAGGYHSTDWTTSDPVANPTVLDAQTSGRGIYATQPVTISSLTVQKGNTAGNGGGAYFNSTATMTSTTFISNAGGYGGGAYFFSTAILSGTAFTNNTALQDGGGAYYALATTLTGTTFISNTANNAGGGAFFSPNSVAMLSGTAFTSNTAIAGGGAYFFSTAILSGTAFTSNTAGTFGGGGAYFVGTATLTGTTFISNTANNGSGGGIYAGGALSLTQSTVTSNSAGSSGGGLYANSTLVMINTAVMSNTTSGKGAGGYSNNRTTLMGSLLQNNTASAEGGGLFSNSALTLSNTQVLNNSASQGGGINAQSSTAVFVWNGSFSNNRCNAGNCLGGGAYFDSGGFVSNTVFINNQAGRGGGVAMGPGAIVNSLFSRNTASAVNGGAAIYNNALALNISYVTIASPTLNNRSAIWAAGTGSVSISNTLIASHTIGVLRTNGTVNENYNLFSSMTTPYSGTVNSGGNSITGTPAFVNPAIDDYHIYSNSVAVESGFDIGLAADFDGDPRPRGDAVDIGFDETTPPDPVCFATPDNGTTVFSGTRSFAVQRAVDAAGANGTVKVAGTCAGVQARGGTTQTVIVTKALTLIGGFTTTNWITPDVVSDVTVLDAQAGGRVISATQPVTIINLTAQNGRITVGDGGGALFNAAAVLSGTTFFRNVNTSIAQGGGVGFYGSTTVINSRFISNTSGGHAGALFVTNAGTASLLSIMGSTFISNVSGSAGGAVWSGANSSIITSSSFINNRATGVGGGITLISSGQIVLTGSVFISNTSQDLGGGAYLWFTSRVTNTQFIANTAATGGGIYLSSTSNAPSNPSRFVNNVFARNRATSGNGNALFLIQSGAANAGYVEVTFNTIASPTLASGSAIMVGGGTSNITNTIMASHTVGLQGAGSSAVRENYNLFSGVTTNTVGTITSGGNSIGGNARFANPAIDDYHIQSTSAATDAGTNIGIPVDVDGDARPRGPQVDIGFDETDPRPACMASPDNGATVFGSENADAVQQAVDAASSGGTVSIAGFCAGVRTHDGVTQTLYISKALTLIGGFTPTNWITSDPITFPTRLDAQAGGRVIYATQPVTIVNLTVQNGQVNDDSGGGAYLMGSSVVSGTTFISNIANEGGGAFFTGDAILTGNTFVSNTAASNAGGAYVANSAGISNTVFKGNRSNAGGALYLTPIATSRIVNSLFIRNSAASGDALMVQGAGSGTVDVIHTTIASPTLSAGSAIVVAGGTANITNTVIASHTVGISQTDAGSVNENYNLFFANGTNTLGAVASGGNSATGNPRFVNTSADDYRIAWNSAATDAGINAGITRDFEGDPRPQGAGFDIGIDETAAVSCYATADNGVNVFATLNANAVQQAVDAASAGGTVKVAGTCAGVQFRNSASQTVVITKALSLIGGFTITNWITSNAAANPTVLDAQAGGRVINATAAVTISNLIVQRGSNGGLVASNTGVVSNTQFLSNTSGSNNGGGVFIAGAVVITGSLFQNNRSNNQGGGLFVGSTAFISNTVFLSNTGYADGGAYFQTTATLTNTRFVSNTSSYRAGGATFNGIATLVNSTFISNTSIYERGGGVWFYGPTTVTGSTFIANRAYEGGGIANMGGTPTRIVNSVFARNSTQTGNGSAMYLYASQNTVVHNTIASPTLAAGSAIYINGAFTTISNTIIASQTTGIQNAGGTVFQSYNLFFGNTNNTQGSINSGSGITTGAPTFLNSAIDDYHIITGSAAINKGLGAGILTDLDGLSRPKGTGFDIGAYEFNNNSPVANAGTPQTVLVGTLVTLTGVASSDAEGEALTYDWIQSSGTPVTLLNASDVSPTFTAPITTGTLVFRLIVTDTINQPSAPALVTITVTNTQPIADAGAPQTVIVGTPVTLTGIASSDADGHALTYGWSQISGTPATFANASDVTATFNTPVITGTLVFRLVVTDAFGFASAPAFVTVTVANNAPVANAGAPQTTTAGSLVSLTGIASSDADGHALTFGWAQISGAPVTLANANDITATFTAPGTLGDLVFRLVVTDAYGAVSMPALVTVTVENSKPTADAGAQQSVNGHTVVSLTGSASSDPNGQPLTFGWTQTNGMPVTLTSATAISPTFTAPAITDTLVFQLVVTDSLGLASDPAFVTVTVSNSVPLADAGTPQTVIVGSLVTLTGSASSDPDDDALAYGWTQVNGEPVTLTDAGDVTPTFTAPAITGTLVFHLVVTDVYGVRSTPAVVTVTVINNAPVADAGAPFTATVGANVSLAGGGSSDPDGHALTFGWTQESGEAVVLSSNSAITPTFTAPAITGTLVFQLVVTDEFGLAGAPAWVTVTLTNTRPVADAGASQSAGVSTTVTLDGSASSDAESATLTYGWSQVSGQPVTLSSNSAVSPAFTTPAITGALVFQLIVTDTANEASAPAVVTVTVTNGTPVANAGAPQFVTVDTVVTLTGAASSDPDGHALTYGWSQVSGDAVVLSNGNAVTPTFTAPGVTGALVFQLVVTDAFGAVSTPAFVTVTVTNGQPVASAIAPATATVGSLVTLGGGLSDDPEGHALTHGWTQISGTAVTLSSETAISPTFTAPSVTGDLVFQLVVTDAFGAVSAPAVVTVTVTNGQPVASATAPVTATVGSLVTLGGGLSNDPEDHALSYGWTQISGADVTLSSENEISPTFTAGVTGGFIFQLVVTDAYGAVSAPAFVTITVTNDTPVADAGVPQSVGVGTLVTLTGIASSDLNGHALAHSWTQMSGEVVTLSSNSTISPAFTAPGNAGTLVFQLVVTDAYGAVSAPALVTITVTNDAPVANAGIAQTATVNTDVTLDGSPSSDPDGHALTYGWSQISGVAVLLSSSSAISPAFTAPLITGTLVFQLVVTDAYGMASAPAMVAITITNGEPTAIAGTPQTVIAGTPVTLTGAASSDPEGHALLAYGWLQTSGAPVLLSSNSAVSPTFTAPGVTGNLVFQLVVTDIYGAMSAPAFVTITVINGRPVANAGLPKSVVVNTPVTLNGNASSDPDGHALTFGWLQVSGLPVLLSSNSALSPTFIAPATTGVLVFQLIVTDAFGAVSTPSVVTITVTNGEPVANAGAPQTVFVNASVTLNGSASSDPEAQALTYEWAQVSGTPVLLSSNSAALPTFTAPNSIGALVFQLVVTDSAGLASQPAFVTVTVEASPVTVVPPSGLTITVTTGNAVLQTSVEFTYTLGAGSEPVTFTWDFGDGSPAVTGPTASHVYAPGTYTATVTATNSAGTITTIVRIFVPWRVLLPIIALESAPALWQQRRE